eukprot:6170260-Prymnesium_polylepis.1
MTTRAPRARTDQLSGWNVPFRSAADGRGPPVHSSLRRSHLEPYSLPVSATPTADQVHRSDRRDGTHQTPRTLPAMRNSTSITDGTIGIVPQHV